MLPKGLGLLRSQRENSYTKLYVEMEVRADHMWSGMQEATTLKLAKNKCIKEE